MDIKNKGQSALEYLMTYGWALIVIVVVIAVLVGMQPKAGVQCQGFGGKMTIKSYAGNTSGLTLAVLNGTGKSLTALSLGGHYVQGTNTYAIAATVPNTGSTANASGTITQSTALAPVAGSLTAGTFTADLNISYNDGDLTHVEIASCNGQI